MKEKQEEILLEAAKQFLTEFCRQLSGRLAAMRDGQIGFWHAFNSQ
jgi:hypothetical protein